MKFFLTSLFASMQGWHSPLPLGVFLPHEVWLLYKYGGWWGWLFHVVTFGIAWFCIHQFIHKKLWGSFLATVVISTVSVLFHSAILFFGMWILYFLRIDTIAYYLVQRPFILAVVMHVFTESCVALLFYKIVDKKRMVMWLLIANVLSIGIGMGIGGKIDLALKKEEQEQAMTPKERREREKIRRRLEKHKLKVIKKR